MEPGTSITTWQQAFEEYRIPATRTIEKQLKSSAARDKEKLRTLVGWVKTSIPCRSCLSWDID